MENNKGQTIFLSVIGVATLLVAIIGATFAYFTASVEGNENASSLTVTARVIAGLTFSGNAALTGNTDVLPGWSREVTFSVTPTQAPTVSQTYNIMFTWSTYKFTDMEYKLEKVSGGDATMALATTLDLNDTDTSDQAATTNAGQEMASYTIPVGETDAVNYRLTLRFKETATDQNAQQGGSFAGRVFIRMNDGTGQKFYTDGVPNGQDTAPNAQGAL